MHWRNSRQYRVWRAEVIRRDKVCQICGARGSRHAHHLNDASNNPDKRFSVDNGITLCASHHIMFHTSYKRSFQEACSVVDYGNFKELYDKITKEIKTKVISLLEKVV